MKQPVRLLLALGLISSLAFSQASDFRTFTNAQGKSIQARLVAVNGPNVIIAMANGQEFTLAINTLSVADQEYIKSAPPPPVVAPIPDAFKFKPGPNDKLPPSAINEAIGQPLFSDTMLWMSSADEVAERLRIPQESKTKNAASYRSYTKDDYMICGAHPFSVAMYAEDDKVTSFSLVFANKGDLFSSSGGGELHFDKNTPPAEAAQIVKKAMDKDLDAISTALTKTLGEPEKVRFGEGRSGVGRMNMQRWNWRGHSILLADAEGEYVGVQVVTSAFADAGGKVEDTLDKVIRERALANLERRENGDVVVGDIPMVDQGPKGYCAPATAERAMRYLGVPADMYILANAGQSGFGGGTSVEVLLDGMASQIRNKRRSFDSWTGEMKMRDIVKHVDKGLPLMWTLYSTEEFNDTANRRTKERKEVTDWAAWKTKVAEEANANAMAKDRTKGHVVLIVGYNQETNEIAFSDSWGERYKERWITLQEAQMVSQDRFYVIGF